MHIKNIEEQAIEWFYQAQGRKLAVCCERDNDPSDQIK